MDVLEHAKSFEDSLGKIVANLRRDGYLVISSRIDLWLRILFGMFDESHISIPKE
jgi:hypothetical protein